MATTTKRNRKVDRARREALEARRVERVLLQRALRQQRCVRQLTGQLQRSRAASTAALRELFGCLEAEFSDAVGLKEATTGTDG